MYMKITFEEQLQKDLAKILCTRKSLVEIGGVVNEDDCTIV